MPAAAAEPLTVAQVAELRDDLEKLNAELEQQLDSSRDEGAPVSLDEPIGRLSRMDAIAQREVSKAGRRQQTLELGRIRAALQAISEGEYGICRACDEPVGYRRLKARPNVTVCVRCQAGSER
jgi:DnaK suppressor protein